MGTVPTGPPRRRNGGGQRNRGRARGGGAARKPPEALSFAELAAKVGNANPDFQTAGPVLDSQEGKLISDIYSTLGKANHVPAIPAEVSPFRVAVFVLPGSLTDALPPPCPCPRYHR